MADEAGGIMNMIGGLFNKDESEKSGETPPTACEHCGGTGQKQESGNADPNSKMGQFFKGSRNAFGNP